MLPLSSLYMSLCNMQIFQNRGAQSFSALACLLQYLSARHLQINRKSCIRIRTYRKVRIPGKVEQRTISYDEYGYLYLPLVFVDAWCFPHS
jgi:hypothetical protein